MLTRESILFQNPNIVTSTVDHELFMASVQTGTFYGLDAIARDIWERLSKPQSVKALCADLCVKYQVSPEQCEADVLVFLNGLAKDGVIQVKDEV